MTMLLSSVPLTPLKLENVHGNPQSNVTVGDYFFSPLHINVTTGTTVIWNYVQGLDHHTVTDNSNTTQEGSPLVNSGEIRPTKSFSFTFYNPGYYPYFCSFHPTIASMNGWLNVTGPPVAPPSSQPLSSSSTLLIGAGAGAAALLIAVSVFLVRRKKHPASSDISDNSK